MKNLTSKFSVKVISAIIALLVALTAIVAVMGGSNTAYAGLTSSFFLESSGFNGELSKGVFSYSADDDVKIDADNVIYFGHTESNKKTSAKLSLRAKLNQLTALGGEFATVMMSLDITDIPTGGAFIYSMALPDRNANFGAAGSLEFKFTKSQSDYVLVVYKSGTAITNKLSVGNKVNLFLDIDLDGTLKIVEDDTALSVVNIGTTMPTGYVAFGYTGAKCKVAMNSVVIEVADYSTPTNPGTIVERFDNNEFNANIWWSEAKTGVKSPSFCHVESNYLKISNAHKPHFTTMYPYSNCSVEFDFFDYACYTEDQDGNVLEYSSESMTVYIGIADYKEDVYTSIVNQSAVKVTIGGTASAAGRNVTEVFKRASISNAGTSVTATLTDVNPCDKVLSAGRRTNVKIEVVDMVAKLWMKYEDMNDYGDPILTMQLRNQPTGYIRFGCYGDTQIDSNGWHRTLVPNWSLDNITVKNLDLNPEICAMPEFKSNIYDTGSDWPYVDKDRDTDLLVNRLDQSVTSNKDEGCGGSIAGTAMVTIPAFIGATAIIIKRRKDRNEEK